MEGARHGGEGRRATGGLLAARGRRCASAGASGFRRRSDRRREMVRQDRDGQAAGAKCCVPPRSRRGSLSGRFGRSAPVGALGRRRAAPHRRMADGAAAVGCRPFRGRPGEGQGPVHPHRFGYAQEETEAFRRGTDIPYAYAPHVALRIPRVYGRGLTSGALRWCRRGGRHI